MIGTGTAWLAVLIGTVALYRHQNPEIAATEFTRHRAVADRGTVELETHGSQWNSLLTALQVCDSTAVVPQSSSNTWIVPSPSH